VFHGRRPLEYLWSTEVEKKQPETDWILTRILWLSGMEVGFNRLGKVDTMQRYIYIHGTNEENLLGTPSSHGCIRMSNDDVIHLYNEVEVGTKVFINEK
jgi:lipoprotein-anchoring transpeptidase ErfK/SrfK